jgi:NifU-like protein
VQCNSNVVAEHFFNPQNVGEAAPPSFIGRSASLLCGATLRVSIHIDDLQVLTEAKFKSAGCQVLIASLSLLTEEIKGKTTAEAAACGQDAQALSEYIGSCEPGKSHCSALACEALIAAIREYSNTVRKEWAGDEALICTCFCVSERTIEHEIHQGELHSIAEVTGKCKAGAGCRSCFPLIQDMIDDYWRERTISNYGTEAGTL